MGWLDRFTGGEPATDAEALARVSPGDRVEAGGETWNVTAVLFHHDASSEWPVVKIERGADSAWIALEPELVSALARSAVALDRLLRRFADGLLARDPALADYALPDFPLAKDVYARGPLGAPFFWGRFDVFERAAGGLAALEYNCDKPAGQREIWASEDIGPARGNPSRGARAGARAWPFSATPRTARSSGWRISSAARRRPSAGNGT